MATKPSSLEPSPGAAPAASSLARAVDRRSFLRYTGATAVVGSLLLMGCDDDDDTPATPTETAPTLLTISNNDTGVLNYAYALEQLEAAFYTKVAADSTSAFSTAEMDRLKQIRDHEVAHREFFKSVLAGDRLKDLTPKWGTLDFGNKAAVLNIARTFEDLGVAAYNGAGKFITNAAYLTVAGKIVSVEARHAAWIRDLIVQNSFASRMSMTGMGITLPPAVLTTPGKDGFDMAMTPDQVLMAAQPFITETLTNNLR
jgi:hypothetical protein